VDYLFEEVKMPGNQRTSGTTEIEKQAGMDANVAASNDFTLSDNALMMLNKINHHVLSKASIVEKKGSPGPGVKFGIYFPGNKPGERGFECVATKNEPNNPIFASDMRKFDTFALKFTLLSVNGAASQSHKGILVVGAYINASYRPECVTLDLKGTNTAISRTRVGPDDVFSIGITAHMLSADGWDPNGTTVTLLVEPAPGAVIIPRTSEPNVLPSTGTSRTETAKEVKMPGSQHTSGATEIKKQADVNDSSSNAVTSGVVSEKKEYKSDEAVARIFDKIIYGKDIKGSPKAKLFLLIWKPLKEKFVKDQDISVTEEELEQFANAMSENQKIMTEQDEKRVAELKRQLENQSLSEEERKKTEGRIKSLSKALEFYAGQSEEDQKAGYRRLGRSEVERWKINKALYEQYGGKVIWQQAGIEPVERYRLFLEEHQKKGDFEIFDKQLNAEFWEYFTRKHPAEVSKNKIDFSKPWWMQRPTVTKDE
jgi:hypothetical protein